MVHPTGDDEGFSYAGIHTGDATRVSTRPMEQRYQRFHITIFVLLADDLDLKKLIVGGDRAESVLTGTQSEAYLDGDTDTSGGRATFC